MILLQPRNHNIESQSSGLNVNLGKKLDLFVFHHPARVLELLRFTTAT